MIPVVALALGACDKKQEIKAPEAPVVANPPAETPPKSSGAPSVVAPTPSSEVPAPTVKVPALNPAQRAAKLGFVQYLPQDTEVVMAFHNGKKSVDRIKASKLWKLIASDMGMGGMTDDGAEAEKFALPDVDEEKTMEGAKSDQADVSAKEDSAKTDADAAKPAAEPFTPASFFGKEFTLAIGKTAGEQTGNLLKLSARMNYFQLRGLTQAFTAAAKSGDLSSMEEALAERYSAELFKNVLTDPEAGMGLFEHMNMPPLYLAFKVSTADRDAASQQLAAIVGNLGFMENLVEPVDVDKAGQKFAGFKISGAKLSATFGENRQEMDAMLDPATVDRLIAAIAKKDLVIVSGTLGDYVVLFIGSSVDDLVVAAEPGQSLLATEALAFCDGYTSKDLAAVIYGKKDALDKIANSAGGVAEMATAIRDGLAGSEGLGDTRDLEALLRMVGDRESALRKMSVNDTVGVAAFFDDGLKIESFGGADAGAVDWKASNKLASLGAPDEVVMFANMTSEAAYDENARAYLEALVETAYALSMKVTAVPMEGEDMAQFKQISKVFDEKFRSDVAALWDAYSGDFGNGLGKECALVVDLNGTVPAVPGIPQSVVNEGKFPRVTVIKPVKDRAKIAASWDKMNSSITNILTKTKELTGQDMPMQKPLSSEKNGNITWFFSIPFLNDDFLPSVTIGDKWFAASTSKNQALDLLAKADKAADGRSGLWFSMNFKALQKFSHETLKMFSKNSEAIMGDNAPPAVRIEKAGKIIDAMDSMDSLTVHARREGGVMRTSIHLKTR